MARTSVQRTLTFWAGIVALSSIAWEWRDSTRFETGIKWQHWSIYQYPSRIMVRSNHTSPAFEFERKPHPPGRPVAVYLDYPDWRISQTNGQDGMVPHSFAFFGTALIWGLALWWRSRRLTRAATVESSA